MSSSKQHHKPHHLRQTPGIIQAYHWIALLAVGITPLLVSSQFVELFEFPKVIFVYVLAIAAIGTTVAWWYQQGQITLVRTVADVPLFAFLLLFTLATIFSIDHYVSLVGYYSRFNGSWLSYVCCAILFYVVVIDIAAVWPGDARQAARRRQILWAWVIACGAVALAAVLYYFHHDPVCLLINHTLSDTCWAGGGSRRVFSTFGQPNTLASYLISGLPLSLTLLFATTRNAYRWFLLAVIGIIWLAVLYTLSRAGWLGLAVALVMFGVFVSWDTLRNNRWWAGGVVALWSIILLLNLGIFSERIVETTSTQDLAASTARTRSLVWQGATQVILHHPWLGTGPETFVYSFLPYRPRELNDTVEWNSVYDKAHNELLQLASGAGIPAAIVWLLIFISPVFFLYRYRQPLFTGRIGGRFDQYLQTDFTSSAGMSRWQRIVAPMAEGRNPMMVEPLINGGLLASYMGVIASLLLAFSTIALNVLMFAALALLLAPSAQVRTRPLPKVGRQVLAFGGGVLVLALVYLWGRYVVADWQIQAAQNAMAQGNLTQAVADLRQAVDGNPYERVYRLSLSYGLALDGAQQQGSARTALFSAADKEAQRALHQGPIGDVVLVRSVDTYTYLAEQDKDRFAPVLGKLLEQGNTLIANSANTTRSLALYYLTYGGKDKAKAALDRLVQLRPLAGDSYLQRAKWDEKYGSPGLARQDLTKAIRLAGDSSDPVYQQAKDQLKQLESKSNY